MKSFRNAASRQAGFTLVEIAIVLVIIGLLLGGVLRGQEMIDSGRIRQVVNDMNSLSASYYAYQDRYRLLPGDDNIAHGFTNAGQAPGATGGNGTINGATPFTSTNNQEQGLFWGHLRNAGFIKGPTTSVALAQQNAVNAFDQQFGVSASATFLLDATANPIPSINILCASLPTKAAQAVDSNLDDGIGNTGSVRGAPFTANTLTAGNAAAAYLNTLPTHTVCKSL